ncbi:putative disease resistance protein isoform X2 [Gossypium australe]|uniref:Putative disease resistance protein isoform X2 n=1 Tax=Gossypium australe TaxID=47621 RepID=A0A5B6U6Z7_9ROSI|nr:putative disease resistance protein isoform X2 [Gossypium australe]
MAYHKEFYEPSIAQRLVKGAIANRFTWPLIHHKNFNKYVEKFRVAENKLLALKEDIEIQLHEQLRYVGGRATEAVEFWLRTVRNVINDAQHVADEVRKGKYLSRSKVAKHVVRITHEMEELCAEVCLFESLVVNDASSVMTYSLPKIDIVGHSRVIGEIYNYLIGQEVRIIGVWGMGGSGKTFIMNHVSDKLREEAKFSNIISISVSQNFDIRRLQWNIAHAMRIDLSDYRTSIERKNMLYEELRKTGSWLLILDDVWQSFSLENVGIPEPSADNGCKIVLTSRSREVVQEMRCKEVQVALLSEDEAFKLFLSKVGEDVLSADPTVRPIMKNIVERCGGFPLAVVTVASYMRGVDPLDWRSVLNQLKGSRDVELGDRVFHAIKFSYDHLAETCKYCFLHCVLYPEDYRISKEEIVEYWIEEGLLDEMGSRKEMKNTGHVYLQKILDSCLLQEPNGKNIVMMHVVRDMTLSLIAKDHGFFVKAGMKLKELPNELEEALDLEKVSLMENFISKIPPEMSPKSKKLTTLLLSGNSLEEIPESFFSDMHALKYLDLSRNPIKILPNSISNLENLTALLLSECKNLEEVPSLSKLLALKKLNLEKTRIEEVPQGMEFLVNLRYLNLRFISCLKKIPQCLLPKLLCLQYLAIHPTLSRPEEIMELSRLETFEGRFADLQDLSKFVDFLREQSQRNIKYFILVGKTVEYKLHSCTNSVTVKDCNAAGSRVLPGNVEEFGIEKCNDLSSLNGVSGLQEATLLKKCRIEECEGLESVFSSSCPPLESLESLVLRHLKNLYALVAYPGPFLNAFSSLKVLFLVKCPKIKILFSTKLPLLQHLINLEQVIIWGCDQMEEIIESEEEPEGGGGGEIVTDTTEFTFPKLKELGLWHLPELKSICSANRVMLCESLQKLEIWNCPKLKRIPLKLDISFDNDKVSHHPPLKDIKMKSNEWKSIKWDHPEAKKALLPLVRIM